MNSTPDPLLSSITHTDFVKKLVATQLHIYQLQPKELIGHFNREESVINSYRGRQVLELLQNADDAGANYAGESRILLQLADNYLAIANTGEPFSQPGFESLMISDHSPKQLHRSQCIGNKGLGFRSVLSWTSAPLVVSGENAVAFSARRAHEIALELAAGIPELRTKFDDWMESQARLPVPTMRFPFVPEIHDSWLQIANEIRSCGYDTVILLPLMSGKYGDVLEQFRQLTGETALFCRHLKQLTIQSREITETWDVNREPENGAVQSTIITHQGKSRLWSVYRRIGHVSKSLLDERLRETPNYEIALAVPEHAEPSSNHKLCVFFPTDDSLPMSMLAHATLDTDDNRKRLTKHDANREVLAHLADFIADVAEAEAERSSASRAFALLAGVERCDVELKDFGFLDRLLAACRMRSIFQRLDGRRTTAAAVRLPARTVWRQFASAEVFPEMFAFETDDATKALINALSLEVYTDAELSRGVEKLMAQMTPAEAGRAAGVLLKDNAIPRDPLPSLLRDEGGMPIPAERTTFMSPESQSLSLPEWARHRISVLHPSFADELRRQMRDPGVRDVRLRLQGIGYHVEEFRFETLARRLEDVAIEGIDIPINIQLQRCRDILRCLFDLSRSDEDLGVIKASVRVITTGGSLLRADQCYFGPDYDAQRLAYTLYHIFGQDEFVSGIAMLGLDGRDHMQVVDFLKRLGVLDQPRLTNIAPTDFGQHGLSKLVETTLAEAPDLSAAFGPDIRIPADVYREFHGIKIEGIKLPDRFIELLHVEDLEPLIMFISGAGAVLLSQEHAHGSEIKAKQGPQRQHRSYQIRIPNPVTFILKQEAWVPCADGLRRRPEQIILHRLGSMVFEGTFFTHVISLQSGSTARSLADSVLLRLGAIYSLEALRPDEVYRLLADLPNRDPKGVNAPSIYRSLLEHAVSSTNSAERQDFVATGKLWGHLNDQAGYYPVAQLRYSSRGSLPTPVRKLIPLVDIDARRRTGEVERIFGVQQLKLSDVVLSVSRASIEARSWSCFASERLAHALPYLYACRLARTADVDGREARRLAAASLCVCAHLRASVTVEGIAREDVVLNAELDGIIADQTVFLVSLRPEIPRMSQSFWRAVGNLLAELVDAAVGGDFASILACEAPDDMRDLLQQISDGRADELLAQARARLAMDPSHAPTNEVLPLPLAPQSTITPRTDLVPSGTANSSPSDKQTDIISEGTFQRVKAPVARASERIRFSTGTPASRGGKRVVQVTDETETISIATRYEELEDRFTIAVGHIHGYLGPRCDLLSVGLEQIRNQAFDTHSIRLDDVERFIEVKGRNQRTGAVELSENELLGAERFALRYFIYRVFCDPTDSNSRELAILRDPINSPARQISRFARFNFHDNSGATWFSLLRASTQIGGASDTQLDATPL